LQITLNIFRLPHDFKSSICCQKLSSQVFLSRAFFNNLEINNQANAPVQRRRFVPSVDPVVS
ncbi:MAG TPA: hypothetical protein VN300_07910, partial [Desulfobacterales bacterium]|nr:hypothetical protein [Desulfobacterales bacterium]